jgi:hypothetical protein
MPMMNPFQQQPSLRESAMEKPSKWDVWHLQYISFFRHPSWSYSPMASRRVCGHETLR